LYDLVVLFDRGITGLLLRRRFANEREKNEQQYFDPMPAIHFI
jgi:hypothetical protein